jgi:hypothetical protein
MRYTMKGSKRMVPCFDFRACLSTMLVVAINLRHCLSGGDRGTGLSREFMVSERGRSVLHWGGSKVE